MDDVRYYFNSMKKDYQSEIDSIILEIDLLPEGNLVIKQRKDCVYYIHSVKGVEKGISKNWDLICKLARKRYLKLYLKELNHNLKAIQRFLSRYQSLAPEDIINSLSATYRSLPIKAFYPEGLKEWAEKDFNQNPMNKNDDIFTNQGISVRSKSEQIIGNALEAKGIAYRYEEAFSVEGQYRYPDFTIQKPNDGSLIFWEHFGCTNVEEYTNSMIKKIGFYQENNLIPWKNLICTYEKDTKDSRRINVLIEMMILL